MNTHTEITVRLEQVRVELQALANVLRDRTKEERGAQESIFAIALIGCPENLKEALETSGRKLGLCR